MTHKVSPQADAQQDLEEACHHLMWVWIQYGGSTDQELIHKDMRAGEKAGEFLKKHGYVECGGFCDTVTEKGRELINKEFNK